MFSGSLFASETALFLNLPRHYDSKIYRPVVPASTALRKSG